MQKNCNKPNNRTEWAPPLGNNVRCMAMGT
jgi:hypothetical protein